MLVKKYGVELVKEESKRYDCENKSMNCPQKMFNVLTDVFRLDKKPQESFYLLVFDTKLRLIGTFEIGRGTLDHTVVDIKGIFQRALLCNASKIAVAHNHPSGEVEPSREDISVTKRISSCGELMEIRLIDHIIVGDGKYYSFADNQML